MFVIFVLSLVLFGGKKLPEVARSVGKAVAEFKRAAAGVENEIRRAIDLESPPTAHQPRLPVSPPRPRPPVITDPSITPHPTPVPPPQPKPAVGTEARTNPPGPAAIDLPPPDAGDELPPPPTRA